MSDGKVNGQRATNDSQRRDRNALYRDVGRLSIENTFTIRIVNKQNEGHSFNLGVSGVEGIELRTAADMYIAGESGETLPVSVVVPHEYAYGGNVITFELNSTDGSDISIIEESRFRGPTERY